MESIKFLKQEPPVTVGNSERESQHCKTGPSEPESRQGLSSRTDTTGDELGKLED